MQQAFQTVGGQVFLMLLLMLLGLLCRKVGFLGEGGAKNLADIMLYIVTPCVVLQAFDRPFDRALLTGFLIAAAAALCVHFLAILLGMLLFRGGDPDRTKILRFALIFGNCGFFSIPVLEAVLGSEGVFYGAAYLAVFNSVVWTYGLWYMSRGSEKIRLRTILLHPGILCVAAGLLLFFSPFSLPTVLAKPIGLLAGLNTPVPMLVIGYYLAGISFRTVLRKTDEWLLYAGKLLILPLCAMGVLYLCGVRGTLLTAITVSSAAPCATICTMFAAKYGGDTSFSAQTVSISTILSLLTITLLVGISASLPG